MAHVRNIAVQTLALIDSGSQAQEALAKAGNKAEETDKALLSDLVYGTLRNRIRIDFALRKLLRDPERLPGPIFAYLETAVYSLLFQDKIPAYAVLNETVRLIKKEYNQKLANLANGVLRSFLRLGSDPAQLNWYGKDFKEAQSIYYSLPPQVAALWRNSYPDAETLFKRSSARPYTGLRLNMGFSASEELRAALLAIPNVERAGLNGFAFPPGQAPKELLGRELIFWQKAGALSLQAAGSQVLLSELGIYEAWSNYPVWDACAGVGGKSLALLEAGIDISLASDVSLKRLRRIPEECDRLNLPRPLVLQMDAAKPAIREWYGHILLDAPCSGLGVLARRPDIKLRLDQANLEKALALQATLLKKACDLLQPGREVCYMTCALNPNENEKQIRTLLANRSDMCLVKEWQTPSSHPWLEGMYGARLKKL